MISNPLSVLNFLVSEGLSLRGAAEAIPVFCRGRSVHGLTSPSPRIDLPLPTDPIPVFCRGEASGNGITGEPAHLMPDASPLRAIQNRVGQRPSRLRVGTSPAPTRRPRRSVPRQSLFFVEAQCGASVAPTTWYTARYAAPRAPTTAICIHTPGFPLLTTRAAGV